jgi:hypothetical protein
MKKEGKKRKQQDLSHIIVLDLGNYRKIPKKKLMKFSVLVQVYPGISIYVKRIPKLLTES